MLNGVDDYDVNVKCLNLNANVNDNYDDCYYLKIIIDNFILL